MQWGKEIQPMRQERRHCGGTPGRTSVTGSPDSGGIHSLIGAIDTSLPRRYVSGCLKRAFKIPIPNLGSTPRVVGPRAESLFLHTEHRRLHNSRATWQVAELMQLPFNLLGRWLCDRARWQESTGHR